MSHWPRSNPTMSMAAMAIMALGFASIDEPEAGKPMSQVDWDAVQKRRRERAEESERQRVARMEAERAAYEKIAAPIRAERLRRKAENFAKRQPKKDSPK